MEIRENYLGIELLFLRLQVLENDFSDYEQNFFTVTISTLIGVVTIEFLAFFICAYLYWKTIDFKLRTNLQESRLSFDHFPVSILMKQALIMKYFQETSNNLL